MEIKKYEIYFDESGNFEDDDLKKGFTPSFVGGVLCHSHIMTSKYIDHLITGTIHAMEKYHKKEFFGIIESLKAKGGRIVLFENNERVRILDGDTTYLNIITEGLIKLLRDLHNEEPQARIEINILIATRQNSQEREENGRLIRIAEDEYRRRFEEKMLVYLGRNKIDYVNFNISFANAKRDKRLMFADIICNTWLTRKAKKKFTATDREKIRELYDGCIRYEVYEDPDGSYLRRLVSENRIGEAIAQLCTHTKINENLKDIQKILLDRVVANSQKEREIYFSYMSLKISQFNRSRDYEGGIQFAKQYQELILLPLLGTKNIANVAEYWMFDTDFYLLTMYDHLGDTTKCIEYENRCNQRISSVSRSWEHLDYYFRFRVRELNLLLNRYAFEEVLLKSKPLIDALQLAKEIFPMIDSEIKTKEEVQSELLGKVYGIRVQAYINLLSEHPGLEREAIETSTSAIKEFSKIYDLRRQYQYRCLLYVTLGRLEESHDYLIKSLGIEDCREVYSKIIEQIFTPGRKTDVFAILHYTNVMNLMKRMGDHRAEMMKNVLLNCQRFLNEIVNLEADCVYPWNLVLWNIGRYWRLDGSGKAADEYISKAITLTAKEKTQNTLYSLAVCMAADRLAWAIEHDSKKEKEYRKEFNKIYDEFMGMSLPVTMRKIFLLKPTEVKTLKELANCILK